MLDRGSVRGRRDGHCSGWYASYWNAFLLPPANDVWGKVMFWHLCVILFTGGSLSQHASQVTWRGGVSVQGVGLCPGGGGGLSGRPPVTVTSGRYASYWNAFLLRLSWHADFGFAVCKLRQMVASLDRVLQQFYMSVSSSNEMQSLSSLSETPLFTTCFTLPYAEQENKIRNQQNGVQSWHHAVAEPGFPRRGGEGEYQLQQ